MPSDSFWHSYNSTKPPVRSARACQKVKQGGGAIFSPIAGGSDPFPFRCVTTGLSLDGENVNTGLCLAISCGSKAPGPLNNDDDKRLPAAEFPDSFLCHYTQVGNIKNLPAMLVQLKKNLPLAGEISEWFIEVNG